MRMMQVRRADQGIKSQRVHIVSDFFLDNSYTLAITFVEARTVSLASHALQGVHDLGVGGGAIALAGPPDVSLPNTETR